MSFASKINVGWNDTPRPSNFTIREAAVDSNEKHLYAALTRPVGSVTSVA